MFSVGQLVLREGGLLPTLRLPRLVGMSPKALCWPWLFQDSINFSLLSTYIIEAEYSLTLYFSQYLRISSGTQVRFTPQYEKREYMQL